MNEQALLPIKKGDNFMLGPYHFVCMGWKNGRVRAARFDGKNIYMHSLSVELFLHSDFRMIEKRVNR